MTLESYLVVMMVVDRGIVLGMDVVILSRISDTTLHVAMIVAMLLLVGVVAVAIMKVTMALRVLERNIVLLAPRREITPNILRRIALHVFATDMRSATVPKSVGRLVERESRRLQGGVSSHTWAK